MENSLSKLRMLIELSASVSVKNNTSLSTRQESDTKSIACLLSDLVFSKVNIKVFGNIFYLTGGINHASLSRCSYFWVASTFALMTLC